MYCTVFNSFLFLYPATHMILKKNLVYFYVYINDEDKCQGERKKPRPHSPFDVSFALALVFIIKLKFSRNANIFDYVYINNVIMEIKECFKVNPNDLIFHNVFKAN